MTGVIGFMRRDTPDSELPEEVKEALENHRNEINAMGDREDFIRQLDLRK